MYVYYTYMNIIIAPCIPFFMEEELNKKIILELGTGSGNISISQHPFLTSGPPDIDRHITSFNVRSGWHRRQTSRGVHPLKSDNPSPLPRSLRQVSLCRGCSVIKRYLGCHHMSSLHLTEAPAMNIVRSPGNLWTCWHSSQGSWVLSINSQFN